MATLVSVPAPLIPRLHTLFSVSAFVTALIAGYVSGLWEALCENAVAKWPVEWWPSVSERSEGGRGGRGGRVGRDGTSRDEQRGPE